MYASADGKIKKTNYNGHVIENPSMDGHLSVATPGLVRGLIEFHRKYGKLKLSEVMAPAISAAALGFEVYPTLAAALDDRKDIMKLYDSTTKIFFRNGKPLKLGEILIQKDLAATLTEISEQGDSVFYQGSIGAKIIAEIKKGGGILTATDLSGYSSMERKPLIGTYRGHEIVSMPPPSSGGVHLIQMLNMIESDDFSGTVRPSFEYAHLLAEVMRRAFADRAVYLGDPSFVTVPTEQLTSKAYAAKLRQSIRSDRATVSTDLRNPAVGAKESESTTHISVVDAEGNAVSTTQTINYSFGSCVVAEGTGIVLNDEMDDFAIAPGVANAFGLVQGDSNSIAPGKTPLSSMTPTIVLDAKGNLKMILGSPGGPKIINAVLQTILNVIDFDMGLLPAVHAARLHHQWLPDQIRFETGALDEASRTGLMKKGHKIIPVSSIGEVSAIMRLADGSWEGVADSRAEGRAAGVP
jgi:gamma-glutamyltranspeptidase/glutathione hydrolase